RNVFAMASVMTGSNKDIKSYRSECTAEDPATEVQSYLNEYNDRLTTIQQSNDEEKIKTEKKVDALVKMICKLERLHPFRDANCRTFCMILLYRECLKMNIMPPLL